MLDQEGNVVALLAEDMGGLGKAVGRQLLRTRRAFTATVFSPDGAPSYPLAVASATVMCRGMMMFHARNASSHIIVAIKATSYDLPSQSVRENV